MVKVHVIIGQDAAFEEQQGHGSALPALSAWPIAYYEWSCSSQLHMLIRLQLLLQRPQLNSVCIGSWGGLL
jgi:hypothetical protein